MNIFINLIFGHLFGDYLFQNKWMALSKGSSSIRCLVHCIIYTLTICLFTWNFNWLWIIIIFLSHYPIDRWSLADKWLELINGRTLKDFFKSGHKDVVGKYWEEKLNYQILRGGFTTLVYAAVDNTMHLALMYYGYLLFVKP